MTGIDFDIQMVAEGKTAEILIYDRIGPSFPDGDEGVSAKSFKAQLDALGDVKSIDVRINSRGGSAFDGMAIYNVLSQHKASITVYIDSLAASAVSGIAMAGDKIKIAESAFLMIHNASTYAGGNAATLRKTAEMLDRISQSAAGVYVARTGKTLDEITELMDAETWFSASEAVENGFADEVVPNKSNVKIPAEMDLTEFKNAPAAALEFVAMLATDNPPEPEEKPVTKETPEVPEQETPETPELILPEDPPAKPEPTNDLEAGRQQERTRQKKIRSLCSLAGCPDKAELFIDGEFSLEETQGAITGILEKKNKIVSDNDEELNDDSDKRERAYKQEFQQQKQLHAKLGISEEQYVEQRLIEDGHKDAPVLMPGLSS